MKRVTRCPNRLAVAKRKVSDMPVKGDLAVTPAQMARMANQGVAISSQIAGSFNDGVTDPSFEVPIGQVRGMDIVDFWEAEKVARKNVTSHIKANEKKFGESTITNSKS